MTDVATTPTPLLGRGIIKASQYSQWTMGERAAYAKMLAGAKELIPSGLRGNTPDETAAKIFLATETGDMLGLHPMSSIGGIDVIEGNATISPQLGLGLIRRDKHKIRMSETGSVETGDLKVTVTVFRADDPDEPIVKSFSIRDAARAGLCTLTETNGVWKLTARSQKGNPLNWEKWPADMCQWRAVGRIMRAGLSDVLLGVSYFPEELEATVDAFGVRTEAITADEALGYVERIKALDDKADMATLFHEINQAEKWTPKLRAEFDAHLATLTKDSRPPRQGAPGHTGDKAIDAPAESATVPTEPGQESTVTESAPESPAETPEPSQGHTAPDEVVEGEAVPVDPGTMSEAEFERYSAEMFEREQNIVDVEPETGASFDGSALARD